MSGSSQCFDIRTIIRIVDGLGAPRQLAGLAPPVVEAADTVDPESGIESDEEVEATNRRSLLTAAGVAPFAAILAGCGRYVTVADVRRVRQLVSQLYTLDDQFGGDAIGEVAAWCLRQVDGLLNEADYADAVGRELQIAYGELAEMAGWLHFDAGRYERARFYYGEALRGAQLADDLNLEVLVLASMNTLARYRGRPREAVQLAQLAQRRAAGWAPPRLAALLAAREAVCWAQLGDAEASRGAMHRAYNVFQPEIRDDDPHWISFFDTAELAARRATASEYLGWPDKSATQLKIAVDGLGLKFQRNRAYYSVRLGLAHLAEGDEAAACAAVRPALPLFADVRSGRARARLAEFCGAVGQSRRPAARELLDHARELDLVESS